MTQGIKRIEELFEVRNPKKPAVMAPFDGFIRIHESVKKVEIEIVSEPQLKSPEEAVSYARVILPPTPKPNRTAFSKTTPLTAGRTPGMPRSMTLAWLFGS